MSASRKSWMVAASMGMVEALKDQGFCRWNYTLRSLQQRAKTKLQGVYGGSAPRSLPVISKKLREKTPRQRAETYKKVMDLSCWGPNTVRF